MFAKAYQVKETRKYLVKILSSDIDLNETLENIQLKGFGRSVQMIGFANVNCNVCLCNLTEKSIQYMWIDEPCHQIISIFCTFNGVNTLSRQSLLRCVTA